MIRISAWTAFFLIVLRVCIGWHFAYEGFSKVKSAYQGKASTDKVFTSENYFRESEGPFGKLVKKQIGDPDQEVIDRLTLGEVSGEPSDISSTSRFPAALAKEWDDYFNRFVTQFKLDDEQKNQAQTKLDQSKATYVKWVQGISDEPKDKKTGEAKKGEAKKVEAKKIVLKVKRKAPGVANQSADYEQEVTVAERAAELKKKSDEVKTAYRTMMELGKDVDAAGLRAKKGEVNSIRAELQKEINDQTDLMKNSLAKVLDTRVTAYAAQADNKDEAATLDAMLKPMESGENPLGRMWDEYAAYVKDFAPNMTDEQKKLVDEELRSAKTRFDRWLADKDMFTGLDSPNNEVAEWRTLYAAAVARESANAKDELAAQEVTTLTKKMQAELKSHSDAMRAQVGTPLLGEDRAKGHAPKPDDRYLWLFPKQWTLIDFIDWSTRWFLLVVGIMLMIGLFTRLSCFSAAGFLVLTILTQPSVPWLPAAPMNEGSYLFVNKNVIELVALIVLMTTRTGKWAGVDALLSWCCCGRKRQTGLSNQQSPMGPIRPIRPR